ncbi:MAG: NAD(P)H-dependent oxidoreductase, partial [Burkholderiales bacterium]|nr:NAD(P)H-dependent oxidoreductase [Burkholderiales bacterium]
MARILVFAGSARRDSLNKKLAREAARFAREAGAEATFVDLDDYPIPLYHGDLEAAEGMPENARKLRALFLAHDALLVASPENNSSVTALLKNTIDWLSRDLGEGRGDDSGLAPWRGKVAGLLAASPG